MNNAINKWQFLTGLVSGVVLMAIVSFTPRAGSPEGETADPVDIATAKTYFQNYTAAAQTWSGIVKGVCVDANQLYAMNQIANEVPTAASFRLYGGADALGNSATIAVGVDAAGNDITSSSMYSASAPNFGLCPVICDEESAITSN